MRTVRRRSSIGTSVHSRVSANSLAQEGLQLAIDVRDDLVLRLVHEEMAAGETVATKTVPGLRAPRSKSGIAHQAVVQAVKYDDAAVQRRLPFVAVGF